MSTKTTEPAREPETPEQLAEAARAEGDALRGRFQLSHLRAWRNCAQLGVNPLAARVKCSTRTISLTERGERMANPSTVRRIAEALGIPPDILLTYSPLDEEAREYVIDLTLRAGRERAAALATWQVPNRWAHRTSAAPSSTPASSSTAPRELCSIS